MPRLSGTLDTFDGAETVRLVAATRRSGLLEVRGTTGAHGPALCVSIAFGEGRILGAAGGSDKAVDLRTCLADLLGIGSGSFVLDEDRGMDELPAPQFTPPHGGPIETEAALVDAETLRTEWSVLERVVPSLDARLRLAPEPPDGVHVDGDRWTAIAAIGAGCSVRTLAHRCGMGPLDVHRCVRRLVEDGLVEVDATRAAPAEPSGRGRDGSPSRSADNGANGASADRPSPAIEAQVRFFSPRAAAALAATATDPVALPRFESDEVVSRRVLEKFLVHRRRTEAWGA